MAAATEITAIRFSPSDHLHLCTTSTSHKASSKSTAAFINIFRHYSFSKTKVYSPLRASKVQKPEEVSSINKGGNGYRNGPFYAQLTQWSRSLHRFLTFPELKQDGDLNYLLKLGAGSFAGAVIIKYGSILFPEITKPNIIEALLIIWLPVVVAVVLLWKQSRYQQ